jgi:3-hydroxybutyryl-CoA dehydrogenase
VNITFRNIGIIGAGNIGCSVAVDLILHNYPVTLVDLSDDLLHAAGQKIEQELRFAIMLRKKEKGHRGLDMGQMLSQLHLSTCLEDVSDCDFIIENVSEEWTVKEKVYRKLDVICPAAVCFGVNTSCISISRVAKITTRPDKVIGVHFMNPVYMKSTVEVMRPPCTSDHTLQQLGLFLRSLDKESVVVNDSPGFVSNRISHLFMNEAAFVYQDNVASARDIDDIFVKCFSHRMGPLETADLIGVDTVMKSLDVLYESYQDPKFICCPLIRQMVQEGKLGRKTGKGFYTYTY